MDKQLILNRYSKPEDKLLISKMMDKIELSQTKKSIQYLDFLDIYAQNMLKKIIEQEKIDNYIFYGAIEEAERKILLFYPEKLSELIEKNDEKIFPIKVIRIQLPKEMYNQYNHRDYLGGLIKLGIKREKIGDILVFEDGADIIVLGEIEKFLLNNLSSLTRFRKSQIQEIKLKDIREKKINKKEIKIIVSSLRIDSIISEILKTSRTKAEEFFKEGRVFLNYEQIIKGTKQVKEGDILNIRGKGKFKIGETIGKTRNGRIKVIVYQFI